MDMTWYDELEARIPKGSVRTRFAPSPTGYMHVGNLRTALYTWLIARKAHGTFIFRLEDTDQTRQVEGATELIYRTMNECGLTHDEGPDVGGPVGPYIQTQRRGLYGKYAQLLVEKGHAYYCFCEKAESEEDSGEFDRAEDPCRNLSSEEAAAKIAAGAPYVIRQKIPHEGNTTFSDAIFGDITVENNTLDDQVLIKRDGLPTYNFANVVDDHLMGITHVVRGSEYLSSSPKYNLLYEAFGWEIPVYVHCSPVMRDAQHKMSKRHGDPSYEDLRAQGYLTDAILNYVALLGWSPRGELAEQEFFSLAQLVDAFDITGISILAFIPLGLYTGLLHPRWPVGAWCLTGLEVSLLFEIIQYILGIGATDITDVITNTTGGILGVLLLLLLRKLLKERTSKILTVIATAATVAILGLMLLILITNWQTING